MANLPWIFVEDYKLPGGWIGSEQQEARARAYCEMAERGQILFFRELPFDLPLEDQKFLREQEWTELRMHKNVSYRPSEDILRGVSGNAATVERLHSIMRNYSARIIEFIGSFLSPYNGKWNLDFASFRPLEEENRDLPLHKRNDLLHVDAFPSRPTRGGRILRFISGAHGAKSGSEAWIRRGWPDSVRHVHAAISRFSEGERSLSGKLPEDAAGISAAGHLDRVHRQRGTCGDVRSVRDRADIFDSSPSSGRAGSRPVSHP
jgi:hypothetical protein